jgi:hypothetical protein
MLATPICGRKLVDFAKNAKIKKKWKVPAFFEALYS